MYIELWVALAATVVNTLIFSFAHQVVWRPVSLGEMFPWKPAGVSKLEVSGGNCSGGRGGSGRRPHGHRAWHKGFRNWSHWLVNITAPKRSRRRKILCSGREASLDAAAARLQKNSWEGELFKLKLKHFDWLSKLLKIYDWSTRLDSSAPRAGHRSTGAVIPRGWGTRRGNGSQAKWNFAEGMYIPRGTAFKSAWKWQRSCYMQLYWFL